MILLKDYKFWSKAFLLLFSKNRSLQSSKIFQKSPFYLGIEKNWKATQITIFIFNISKQILFKIDVLPVLHRKTPVLESLFNKVAGLMACSFFKKRLKNRYFSVKFAKVLPLNFYSWFVWSDSDFMYSINSIYFKNSNYILFL